MVRLTNQKWFYLSFSLILLVFSSYILVAGLSDNATTNIGVDFDYRVYQGAVFAFNSGLDPYILSNLPGVLPYTYLPHMLIFLSLLVNSFVYHLFILVILGISFYFVLKLDNTPDVLFLSLLFFVYSMNAYWTFLTGNISGPLFLLFTTLSFYLLKDNHYNLSALSLGFMSSWSVFPLIFSFSFLSIPRSLLFRVRLILISFSVPILLFIVSYILNPGLGWSFLGSLTSDNSALRDMGGVDTPQPNLLFDHLATQLGLSWHFSLICLVLFGFLILFLSYLFLKQNPNSKMLVYSYLFLAAFLLLPRIKPYYFILLVVPLYLLMKEYNYELKLLVLGIFSLPYLIFLNSWLTPGQRWFPSLFYLYSPILSLFVLFIFIFLINRRIGTNFIK